MTRVPDWKVERYALGELPPEELEAVRRQLEEEEGGLARLARLESSNREILMTHPPRVVVEAVRRRAGMRRRRTARNLTLVALPLAVAVAGGLVMALPEEAVDADPVALDDDYYGIKTDHPVLVVHRQVEGGDERLEDQHHAAAGDVLQLSYQAMGWPHGVIVSLDGAGTVTLHHPLDQASTALDPDGRVSLEDAYRLDDAPAFERFVLVTGVETMDVDAVLDAADRVARDPSRAPGAELPLSPDLDQVSLTLWKTP